MPLHAAAVIVFWDWTLTFLVTDGLGAHVKKRSTVNWCVLIFVPLLPGVFAFVSVQLHF